MRRNMAVFRFGVAGALKCFAIESPDAVRITRQQSVMKKLATILLLSILVLPAASRAEPETSRQNVLCLHSYDPSFEWEKSVDTAIVHTLLEAEPGLSIFHEYMGVLRNPDPAFQVDLFNYLKSKYRNTRIRLIIASDNSALNFLLNYRDWLMGQVPVVFLGINQNPNHRRSRKSSRERKSTC